MTRKALLARLAFTSRQIISLCLISAWIAGAGMLTLPLACIGPYAVVALAVAQRRRKIRIRIALGARPSEVSARFLMVVCD